MQKKSIFSLMTYAPWMALLVLLLYSCKEPFYTPYFHPENDALVANFVRARILDADTKEDLILYYRPGGIYLADKIKLLQEDGKEVKDFKLYSDAAGDSFSFMYADSSDTDAAIKMKTKIFFLHLETIAGQKDIDTLQVDYKFAKTKNDKHFVFEKVSITFNDKILVDRYNNGAKITLLKKP